MIHHTLLICRNGVIERDDLRLSNMRIERQDDYHHTGRRLRRSLADRAFQKLFEQQAGALHEKVEDALMRAAYRFSHYNRVHTAALLGLSRNVTRTRLIKMGELGGEQTPARRKHSGRALGATVDLTHQRAVQPVVEAAFQAVHHLERAEGHGLRLMSANQLPEKSCSPLSNA